ncbi:MAG: hypothetical protein HRU25_15420 [Psychrobium sp.]|nr:hypothetical protein [Psychrobium sp.]
MSDIYIKLGWVLPCVVERHKGLSPCALKNMVCAGKLEENFHWRKAPNGKLFYNFESLDDWVLHGYNKAS